MKSKNPYYRNIEGFRSSSYDYNLNDEETNDLFRCSVSNTYFFNKFIPSPNNIQNMLFESLSINRFNLISTPEGIYDYPTDVICIDILHSILKHSYSPVYKNGYGVVICSDSYESSINILNRIKNLYLRLPFHLRMGVKKLTHKSIHFDCGYIKSVYNSRDIIGSNHNFILINRVSDMNYKNIIPIQLSLMDTKLIILSNGKIFSESPSVSGIVNSLFRRTAVKWSDDENLDDGWKYSKINEIGIESFCNIYENLYPGDIGYNRYINLENLLISKDKFLS